MTDETPANDFANFVDQQESASPQMPFMHTTDLYRFRSIIRASILKAKPCNNFKNENLLYLFYGRPAYRPNSNVEANSIDAYKPVCLILANDMNCLPQRAFPFDTGAYSRGLYNQHFHEEMDLWDFQMKPIPDSAMKIVNKFFGNNINYYMGKPLESIATQNFQFEANSYISLINEKGKTPFDDRRATVEFQICGDVELTRNNVVAVCMPNPFCDEPDVINTVVTKWGAKILPYKSYHANPIEDIRSIFDRSLEYLLENNYV